MGGVPVRRLVAESRHGRWLPYYEEATDPIHEIAMEHALAFSLFETVAWGMTIVFAATDVVTTAFGLPHPLLTESVPITRWIVAEFGWSGLVVEHAVVLGLLGAMWHVLPRPYRIVVPLEGAWAGYLIVHSNLVTIVTLVLAG